MKKKYFSIMVSLTLVLGVVHGISRPDTTVYAQEKNTPMQNEYYTVIDEDGNVEVHEYKDEDSQMQDIASNDYDIVKKSGDGTEVVASYDTYDEAKTKVRRYQRLRSSSTYEVKAVADTKAITHGVAYLKGYITYKEVENGKTARTNYTHGSSANDAAYISTSSDGKTVRVKQAGVVMDIPASNVEVKNYDESSMVSYYEGKNGKFYHYYRHGDSELASTQVGYTPDYLVDGVKYYSYDGHYFYNNYVTMLNDYKAGYDYYEHAVNKDKPFYNYYQYLSMRSTTSFTAQDFNQLIIDGKGADSGSKLLNQGTALLNVQNKNGINASLMIGVAINESAWGLSKYALDRNNLFGIGAVDSDPDKALRFDTVEDCLNYFAHNTISAGYLDGMDWRYRGSHLGDKRSGINVKYASDPYWGEKAASFSYTLNSKTGNKDYQKYSIGISKHSKQNLYKTSGLNNKLYDSSINDKYEDLYCYPVTILNTEGNSYRILSDTILSDDRSKKNADGYFNINKDYVYVPKSDVNIRGQIFANTFNPGDVNGDGKVSTLDYIAIENHIMNRKKLIGSTLSRADVNEDGKVSTLDYIAIENHIMGRKKLF